MPSTYSNLKIQLMATGENNTTWGDVTNLNLGTALEEAIVGSADVPFSSADVTLTLTDTNASQTARNMRLNLTGTATAGYNLIVPAIEKPYIINNGTDGTITVKNATGTGIAVPAGKTMWVYNNGTNVVDAVTRLSSLTLGTDLAVADGGTGASTFTSNGVLIGNGTSAITATAAGTTGQVLVGNTGSAPTWATLSTSAVTSFSAGTTGFTPNTATTGAITLAGTLNVANGGTGATSLTSGYLVKGNGTSAASASVVYDDGTNVGIGTSSPGNKLSVVGGQINTVADDAYALALNATTGNVRTYPYLSSYSGSALVAFSAGYAGNGPLSIAASTLQLWTGGSERMRIDSSGNVGIGTSSPNGKLDIASGNVFITQDYELNWHTGGTKRSQIIGDSSNNLKFSNRVGGVLTETMRLDSSGNLGLGVTPSAWSASGSVFQMVRGYIRSDGNTTSVGNNAYYNGSNWIYSANGYATYYDQYANTGAHAWFNAASGTAGNAITFTQAMTLDASGNLGIGTASPASNSLTLARGAGVGASIEIAGNGTTPASTSFTLSHGSDSAAYVWNRSNAIMAFGTNNTERMRIDTSGNVGIGTSPSGDRLNVNGNAQFTTATYCFVGATSGTVQSQFAANAGSGVEIRAVSNHPMAFFTNNTERARIDSSGNLLVGTTSSSFGVATGFRTGDSGGRLELGSASSTNANIGYDMYSTGAGAYRFYVDWAGTIYATSTSITAISDIRLKENVRDLDAGLDTILALKPRRFDWRAGKGKDIKDDMGFIAQEMEEVLPALVGDWKAGEGEPDDLKSVKAGDLIPVLVKAIQELTARVAQLEGK